jgi:hypothetical protein
MWVIIRDFMNLFFIFGLVYIGFKMILNSSDSNTRRWLVNLIIAALLINFSLFFTKVVVDVSNQLAAQIAVAAFDQDTETPSKTYRIDMAGSFMNRMNITSVFSQNKNVAPGADDRPANAGLGYIFFTAILFLVTAFVFAAGGLLLTIRFALLNLFLVLSPIMFIGWILPPVSDLMSRYWKAFLGRAFFAPVYLLFIYFSLTILDGFQNQIGTKSAFSSVTQSGSGQVTAIDNSIPFFILVIIFMIASLVIAQKMGADGAGQAVSLGRSLSKKAGRLTTQAAGASSFGLAARVGRSSAGALGNAATSNNNRVGRFINKSAQGSGLSAFAARRAQDTASVAANASFDVRGIGGVGKSLGIGEGKKGGFKKGMEEREKSEKDRAKKYAYNDQAYDDHFTLDEAGNRVSVRAEFDEYTNLQDRRNETFQRLAASKDEQERMQLHEQVTSLNAEVSAMENVPPLNQQQIAALPPAEAARRERLVEFNRARAAARANYGQRLYAANLETRFDGIPLIGQLNLPVVGRVMRSQERTNAASEIVKQAGQSPQEAFIRNFLNQAENNNQGAAGGGAPAAGNGGGNP